MPNLVRDSKNLGKGLATESVVLQEIFFLLQAPGRNANVVKEYSQRIADSVVNPSQSF